MLLTPEVKRQRQVNLSELGASLVYTVSYRTGYTENLALKKKSTQDSVSSRFYIVFFCCKC